MKVKIPPLYERNIDPNDPFKVDAFNRKVFATNLTTLFRNTTEGLVITIDAKWGDGKTTFVKLWEQELKNTDDFIPIYYNAFKHDFCGDAFSSIAITVDESLNKYINQYSENEKQKAQLKYLKDTSKKLAIDLVAMGTGYAVNHLTAGLINNKPIITWIKNAFYKLTFKTLEVTVDEKFEAYKRAHENIKSYHNALSELLNINKDRHNKIVFFIDELDRCRPDFAVELIEKTKHLFNIDNVFFVLTINREQLLSTIASVYGVSKTESFIYLQKFVHLETKLPSILPDNENNNLKYLENFLENLINEYEIDIELLPKEIIFNSLGKLFSFKELNLNPRSIERILSFVSIAISSCKPDQAKKLSKNIMVLAIVKISKPDLYEVFKSGTITEGKNTSIFHFLKTYYEAERKDVASNSFTVTGIKESCLLLDIYEIPMSEPNKSKQPKSYKLSELEKMGTDKENWDNIRT